MTDKNVSTESEWDLRTKIAKGIEEANRVRMLKVNGGVLINPFRVAVIGPITSVSHEDGGGWEFYLKIHDYTGLLYYISSRTREGARKKREKVVREVEDAISRRWRVCQ